MKRPRRTLAASLAAFLLTCAAIVIGLGLRRHADRRAVADAMQGLQQAEGLQLLSAGTVDCELDLEDPACAALRDHVMAALRGGRVHAGAGRTGGTLVFVDAGGRTCLEAVAYFETILINGRHYAVRPEFSRILLMAMEAKLRPDRSPNPPGAAGARTMAEVEAEQAAMVEDAVQNQLHTYKQVALDRIAQGIRMGYWDVYEDLQELEREREIGIQASREYRKCLVEVIKFMDNKTRELDANARQKLDTMGKKLKPGEEIAY